MMIDYLSQEKHDELTRELGLLKTSKRKEVAERLEFAKSLGDLSENAEYHAAREEQAETEDRINQLENLLKTSQIMSIHHSSVVEIGSTLTVEKVGNHQKSKLTIVGSEEANVPEGKISGLSPMGTALLGKKKGDEARVNTPKGEVVYKITSID